MYLYIFNILFIFKTGRYFIYIKIEDAIIDNLLMLENTTLPN